MNEPGVGIGVAIGIGICLVALVFAAWGHNLGKKSVLTRLPSSCEEALR